MDGIRVNSGVKKIEVNDNGDFIFLPLSNDKFVRRFYDLVDEFEKLGKEIEESDADASFDKVISFSDTCNEKIDNLFGEGTCGKVFNDFFETIKDCPVDDYKGMGTALILDLLYQLMPFIEEYQKERETHFNKYAPGKLGSAV